MSTKKLNPSHVYNVYLLLKDSKSITENDFQNIIKPIMEMQILGRKFDDKTIERLERYLVFKEDYKEIASDETITPTYIYKIRNKVMQRLKNFALNDLNERILNHIDKGKNQITLIKNNLNFYDIK